MRVRSLHAAGNQLVLVNLITARVDMKQKITTMLELQDSMNSRVNPDWRNAGNEWYRAIWMEASEMLEHYGWKWWKKQEPDAMQVKLEIVDIVHFALSICLEEQKNSETDTIAAAIEVAFENPRATDDIRTTIELLAKETLVDQSAHFAIISGVMKQVAMPFDELYEIYVGKNVLNLFRQDNGYKEGTYSKIWNGREDNEYLADILQQMNCNSDSFRDDIYRALAENYPESVVA
jgi:dimeric dUTPase (all-alpha-NTP-PPase superfamily)